MFRTILITVGLTALVLFVALLMCAPFNWPIFTMAGLVALALVVGISWGWRNPLRESSLLRPLRHAPTPIAKLRQGISATIAGTIVRADMIGRGVAPEGPWLIRVQSAKSILIQRASLTIDDGTARIVVYLGPGLLESFYRHPRRSRWEQRFESTPTLIAGEKIIVSGDVIAEADPESNMHGMREPALRLAVAGSHVLNKRFWLVPKEDEDAIARGD